MTAILYASLIACATLIIWLYEAAVEAERDRDRWKAEAAGWQESAERTDGFAEDAVRALAQARNALDERDALIEAQEALIDHQHADIERLEHNGRGAAVQAVRGTIRYGQALQRGELADLCAASAAPWPRLNFPDA